MRSGTTIQDAWCLFATQSELVIFSAWENTFTKEQTCLITDTPTIIHWWAATVEDVPFFYYIITIFLCFLGRPENGILGKGVLVHTGR